MKVLICSSLHLRDVPELPQEFAAKLTGAVKESGTAALFITGGLFDDHRFSDDLYNTLYNCFSALSGTHVFICPGASDPYVPSSPYILRDWPENVHIFKNRLKAFEISANEASEDAAVRVYGMGASRHRPGICALTADRLPKTDPAFLNVLVLAEAPRDNDGNIDIKLLNSSGFDAFIFGGNVSDVSDNIILVSDGLSNAVAGTITKNFPPYGFLPVFPAESAENSAESGPEVTASEFAREPADEREAEKAEFLRRCKDLTGGSELAGRLLFDAICGKDIPEVTGK